MERGALVLTRRLSGIGEAENDGRRENGPMSNGPWQPRGQGPRNPNPWGGGPSGGGSGGGGGREPPDLEDILRRGQDRLRRVMPGGGGDGGLSRLGVVGLAFLGLLAVAGWMLTGFYTVRPNEMGIERVFGRFLVITPPGLNWNWPYPIGRIDKPTIGVQTIEIGLRTNESRRGGIRDVREESLMLTGDENIVDVDFSVLWLVDAKRPQDFVFNLRSPEVTVKAVAESAMREVIGRREIQPILTGARLEIERAVQELMQKTLNAYGAGIIVQQVRTRRGRVSYAQEVEPLGEAVRLPLLAEHGRVAVHAGEGQLGMRLVDDASKPGAATQQPVDLAHLGGVDRG